MIRRHKKRWEGRVREVVQMREDRRDHRREEVRGGDT